MLCYAFSQILLNCMSQADRKTWMEKLQAQNSKLVPHEHHGHHGHHNGGSPQLSVPRMGGHQRQASYGGEGR